MTGTFEGVGSLQFSPDNKYCFAYSGEVSVSDTELNLIDIKTNSEYIVSNVQLGSKAAEDEDYEVKIYFNDVVIFAHTFHQQGTTYVNVANSIPIIIPPFTHVKISLDNIADSDSRIWTVGLTGKVSGAIEQENLESITDNNKWASL